MPEIFIGFYYVARKKPISCRKNRLHSDYFVVFIGSTPLPTKNIFATIHKSYTFLVSHNHRHPTCHLVLNLLVLVHLLDSSLGLQTVFTF